MADALSTAAVRVLLITASPDEHQTLASELSGRGIAVVLTSREPVVARELRGDAAMVLVDLGSASTISSSMVRRLNEPSRRAPVVGLVNGAWPSPASSASALRVDGLARADQPWSIARAAAAVAHTQVAASVH